MSGKRENYLSWEEFFFTICFAASERSKDPNTQVGAVIEKDNKVLSVGYNGTPKGMSDDDMPWDSLGEETGDLLQIKNSFVIHAEANALNNLPIGIDLTGATMYVTLSPCPECAKRIAQTGIKKVVYFNEYKRSNLAKLSKKILEIAGVECVQTTTKNLGQRMLLLGQKIQLEERKNSQKLIKEKN